MAVDGSQERLDEFANYETRFFHAVSTFDGWHDYVCRVAEYSVVQPKDNQYWDHAQEYTGNSFDLLSETIALDDALGATRTRLSTLVLFKTEAELARRQLRSDLQPLTTAEVARSAATAMERYLAILAETQSSAEVFQEVNADFKAQLAEDIDAFKGSAYKKAVFLEYNAELASRQRQREIKFAKTFGYVGICVLAGVALGGIGKTKFGVRKQQL